MKHEFTDIIKVVLESCCGGDSEQVFKNSELIQYVNLKTVSANRGSKARASFGNLYALYVLLEDYVKNDFHRTQYYSKYEGSKFSRFV